MVLQGAFRTAFIGYFASGAVIANAFYIDLQSRGTFVSQYPKATFDETVIYQSSTVPTAALTNLHYQPDFLLDAGAGRFRGNGQDGFNFSLTVSGATVDIANNLSAASGTWTCTSGTGFYAGILGKGVWSFTDDPATNSTSYSTFSGNLTAVPEPATFVVLGMGAFAISRRRR